MPSHSDSYVAKRMTAAAAVALIKSGARIAMGLGVSQPPALLAALADRAARGDVDRLTIYYLLSTRIAGETVLRSNVAGRIRPVSLFHSGIERALETSLPDRACIDLIPTPFFQVPRV